MNLPDDLSEGWWWVRMGEGSRKPGETLMVWAYRTPGGPWMLQPEDLTAMYEAAELAPYITAMERVAAPSWERG